MITGLEMAGGGQRHPLRIVRLDQRFPLVDPGNPASRIQTKPSEPNTLTIFPGVAVEVPSVPVPLVVEFSLDGNHAARRSRGGDVTYIAPFSPDNGAEDVAGKLRQHEPHADYVQGHPGQDQMYLTGVLSAQDSREELPTLPRLRLDLRFPAVRVAADFEQWGGTELVLNSGGFYRADEPLQPSGLLLPASPGKLSKVEASVYKALSYRST